jgi:hypothetical protein
MSNKDHESFESWIFSEENQGILAFFIICVSFTIWYVFHLSNLAVACVANGGY